MPATSSELSESGQDKNALRAAALSRRDALSAEIRAAAAETIAQRPFPVPLAEPGLIVSGYMPIRSELNPLPVLRALAESGARLALPVVAGRGKPLVMRAWTWGAPLERRQWGIREPGLECPEVAPDILLVPLAAFDRRGYRIGYGAGYYDMTISALLAQKPITTVGLAFAAQEIAQVPDLPHDEPLDFVMTERETIPTKNA